LVATDPGSAQGFYLALSKDANTAVVGGSGDSSVQGAAWIYVRSAAGWTQQGSKLAVSNPVGSVQGSGSVALSADGNTAIFGGTQDNGSAGAALVYTRTNGVWRQQGAKLVGTGAIGLAQQGWSIALSGDGNTALIGGPGDDNKVGAAWIFQRTGGVWRQPGNKLVGSDVVGPAGIGSSVALSADGNTAVIGGGGDSNSVGALWVFTRTGDSWKQQGSKLVGSGAADLRIFLGKSVAISDDGNTIIAGGYRDVGAAWVFTRSNGTWTQQGEMLNGRGLRFLQGSACLSHCPEMGTPPQSADQAIASKRMRSGLSLEARYGFTSAQTVCGGSKSVN
jgi:hypothetical protein